MKTTYQDITAFVTRDGSIIRELMHPNEHSASLAPNKQSLAEAIVHPGQETKLHQHRQSEELYHITAGEGLMTLATDAFVISVGDTVCIPPGTPHRIKNTGDTDLKILCCCSPPYAHDDTELLE